MDTVGRTTLKLTAMNVVDDSRDMDIIVSAIPRVILFSTPRLINPKHRSPTITPLQQGSASQSLYFLVSLLFLLPHGRLEGWMSVLGEKLENYRRS